MGGEMTFEEFINSAELPELVQKNTDLYRAKWGAMYPKAASINKMAATVSWSWAGFLLSGPWLFYRKMYLEGAVWTAGIIGLTVAENLTGKSLNVATLGLSIAVGMYGNGWYFKHTYKRLTALRGGDQFASKAGGVSWPIAIASSVSVLLLVAALSIPDTGWTAFRKGFDEAGDGPVSSPAQKSQPVPAAQMAQAPVTAFEPAGQYDYREPGLAGDLLLIPTGDGSYQLRIETADPKSGNSCELGTDSNDPLILVPHRQPGKSVAVFNWNEKSVEGCAFELQVEPSTASLSSVHTNCSGLCGMGVDVTGAYVKKPK